MAYASVGALHPSTIVAAITRKVRLHRHPGLDPGPAFLSVDEEKAGPGSSPG